MNHRDGLDKFVSDLCVEMMNTREIARQILSEIDNVLQQIDEEQVACFRAATRQARRIFTYSVGREGLVLRSFAMRLMHLGLEVGVVGEMTTGPIGPGALLIVSAGPGYLSTVEALMNVARQAGGRVALLTARPEAELARKADLLLVIPGQTMAEGAPATSLQPLGSVFEQALWVLLDAIVIQLKEELGETDESMAQRHTNLE